MRGKSTVDFDLGSAMEMSRYVSVEDLLSNLWHNFFWKSLSALVRLFKFVFAIIRVSLIKLGSVSA